MVSNYIANRLLLILAVKLFRSRFQDSEIQFIGIPCDILEAIDLVDNGSIKPVVSKVFKLEEANKAFEKIIGKNTLGRVVLIP